MNGSKNEDCVSRVSQRCSRIVELLRADHGSRAEFARGIDAIAHERGLPNFRCLAEGVGPGHVHVVWIDDSASEARVDVIVGLAAKHWLPVTVRVTADRLGDMGRKSLALIDANHKLHTENAALRQRVASLQTLVGAILLSTGALVAFAIWRGVVRQ